MLLNLLVNQWDYAIVGAIGMGLGSWIPRAYRAISAGWKATKG